MTKAFNEVSFYTLKSILFKSIFFIIFSRSASRNSTRRILPEFVLGNESTNSIARGYLYGATSFFAKVCNSLTRSSLP